MGSMQNVRDTPLMYEGSALTTGGNSCIHNGDEALVLDATIQDAPSVASDLREDDSHLVGAYRDMASDFAGS